MGSSSTSGDIHVGGQNSGSADCGDEGPTNGAPPTPGDQGREGLSGGGGTRTRDPRLMKPGVASSPQNDVQISREPADEYHASPGISCSQLKDYAQSPLGYFLRHIQRVAPQKSSPALRAGTLLHLRHELSDEEWQSRLVVADESVCTATGQLGKSGERWLAELGPNQVGITPAELAAVDAQWAGVQRNPAAVALIRDRIDAEFNCRWYWDGHLMRCRGDGATPSLWYDLKTTSDQYPLQQFGSSVKRWGYDLQSAVYEEAAVRAGWPEGRLTFIVISTVYPHHCHVVQLPPAVVRRARDRVLRYLAEIRERTEFGHWLPDDYGEITELSMPYWRD
jgi:hypothetical protein